MYESRPIIALDLPSFDDVKLLLALFPADEKLYVKIGMKLHYAAEPEIVRYVKSLGHSVFLDLELHDIPNTARSVIHVLSNPGVDMTNAHATGGVETTRAAYKGLRQGLKLAAVTQLMSTSDEQMKVDQNIQTNLVGSVLHYTKKVNGTGLGGVVCSAHEVAAIKGAASEDFVYLAPGIRPAGATIGDQKCVITPSQASATGSSYIVVGRPATKADDPIAAYKATYDKWNAQYWSTKIALGLVWG